jgi:hypothetical protein
MCLNNSSAQSFYLALTIFVQTIRKLHFCGASMVNQFTNSHSVVIRSVFMLFSHIHSFKNNMKIGTGVKIVC